LNHARAATDTIPTRELSRPQGRNFCPSVLGRILSLPPVGERTAPHPSLSPSDGEREKSRWQQGRARPLTPALSPSDGERENGQPREEASRDLSPRPSLHPMERGGRVSHADWWFCRDAPLLPVSIWLFTLRRFGFSIGP